MHDIVASTSLGWHRTPVSTVSGTRRNGVSAALWTHERNDVQEVDNGGAPLDVHVISFQCSRQHAEVFKDGRHHFTKEIRPGTVSWMEAGVRPRAVHRGAWRVLHIYLPPALMTKLSSERGQPSFEARDPECGDDPAIERISREVLMEMRSGLPLSRLRIDALGQDLAIQLLRRHSNLAGTRAAGSPPVSSGTYPNTPDVKTARDWRVRRGCDFLEANMGDDISLTELAGELGMSPSHVSALFRAGTGEPPHRWLMRRRVDRACELLGDPRRSIMDIAHACGFASSQHLATVFQKRLGMTPSAYRLTRLS